MKTVVFPNDLTIPSVITDELYREYVTLLEEDIQLSLPDASLKEVPCPGCGRKDSPELCLKIRMTYRRCPDCGSFFVSPRPDERQLENFYHTSQAGRLWRQEMSRMDDKKLYYIYGPRVDWLTEWADESDQSDLVLADVQTKYPFLIKHLLEQKVFKDVKLVWPQLFEQENLLPTELYFAKGKDLASESINMLTAFEAVERMADPQRFFDMARNCLKVRGLLLFTTATSSGFEYQVLGPDAPNLNPINRMNLLSLESLTTSLERRGFEVLELSTPGRLDVEIVRDVLAKNKTQRLEPFWAYFFKNRGLRNFQNLQQFLQENRLSSHVRVVARKKE